MYFETLKSITDAEEGLLRAKADAQVEAKNMISEAEKKGQTAVSEAILRAEEETRKLMDSAAEKASKNAAELKESTSNLLADIRRLGEARLQGAASLIVERIVQS